jgi:hypothetical protein
MTTIVTRVGKGSPLTWTEVDTNFTNLNSAKYESGNNATLGTIQGSTITATTSFSGALNGTVGATTPAAGTFTSLSDSGNLTFTGTGNRILGDFSNATLANRVAFQTSITNGNTSVSILPNGTGNVAGINAFSSSDAANSSFTQVISFAPNEARFVSGQTGTGSYLPMTFYTGGSERMRIDTSGNVGIAGTTVDGRGRLQVYQAGITGGNPVTSGSTDANQFTVLGNNNVSLRLGLYASGNCWIQNSASTDYATNYALVLQPNGGNVGIGTSSPGNALVVSRGAGTASYLNVVSGSNSSLFGHGSGGELVTGSFSNQPYLFYTNSSERMRIDSSGNVLVGGTAVLNSSRQTIYASGGVITVGRNTNTTAGKFWSIPYIDTSNTLYILNQNNAGVYLTDGATSWTANSDERLKDIIEPITDATNKVSTLRAVIGKYKTDEENTRRTFLIAQDVQAVLPEAVSEALDGYLGVAYTDVIPLLVAAIKELNAKVTALEAQLQGN